MNIKYKYFVPDGTRPGISREAVGDDGEAHMSESLRPSCRLLSGADSLDSGDAPDRARPSRSIIIGAQAPP